MGSMDSIERRREKVPVKRMEQVAHFDLWNIEDLPQEERLAVEDAILAYQRSTNPEFRAGVAVVAEDGTKAVRHNEKEGQEGHAEMLAIGALSRTVKPGEFKLKILALAATAPDEELVRKTELYGPDVTLSDIEVERPCGRCLKFMADYSGSFISNKGTNEDQSDVTILLVTATGQVLRTSLRSLHPMPHRPRRIPLRPLAQDITNSPYIYPTGFSNGK
jgi:cytidine deaminase